MLAGLPGTLHRGSPPSGSFGPSQVDTSGFQLMTSFLSIFKALEKAPVF